VRDERKGVDGATVIIEGVKDGKYQVVNRWSPVVARNAAELAVAAVRAQHRLSIHPMRLRAPAEPSR
jgi:hypothetical protein